MDPARRQPNPKRGDHTLQAFYARVIGCAEKPKTFIHRVELFAVRGPSAQRALPKRDTDGAPVFHKVPMLFQDSAGLFHVLNRL